jgi:hypothetical protein
MEGHSAAAEATTAAKPTMGRLRRGRQHEQCAGRGCHGAITQDFPETNHDNLRVRRPPGTHSALQPVIHNASRAHLFHEP